MFLDYPVTPGNDRGWLDFWIYPDTLKSTRGHKTGLPRHPPGKTFEEGL
jgi:hypothetical protein